MLLDTMVFYNGLYFVLRSGIEHHQLWCSPCQIEIVEKPGERPYPLYREDMHLEELPGWTKGEKTDSQDGHTSFQHCMTNLTDVLLPYSSSIGNFVQVIQWPMLSTYNHLALQVTHAGSLVNLWVTPHLAVLWFTCVSRSVLMAISDSNDKAISLWC